MKRIYTIILSLAIALAAGIGSVQAQVVDVCAGNDSVVLKVGNFRYGYVQWQVSEDNELWSDIDGAIDTIYRFLPERPLYYRASVRFPACADITYFSQVTFVQMPPKAFAGPDRIVPAGTMAWLKATPVDDAEGEWHIIHGVGGQLQFSHDPCSGFMGEEGEYQLTWTVTNACGSNTDTVTVKCVPMEYQTDIVIVDETDVILSDSTQRLNGEYIVSFNDPVPDIHEGSVLLGYLYPSFLRKVVSFEREGNMFTMQTVAGTLTDVVMSGAFSFDPVLYPLNKRMSEVKYLDHFPTRKEMQEDPSLLRDGSVYVIKDAVKGNTGNDFDVETVLHEDNSLTVLVHEFDFNCFDQQLDGLKYSCEFNLNPHFDANLVFANGDFSEARIGMYDASVELVQHVRMTKPIDTDLWEKDGRFNRDPMIVSGLMVGMVPTYLMLDFGYLFEVEASTQALMEFTKTTRNTFTFEMSYNALNGQLESRQEKGTPYKEMTGTDPTGSFRSVFMTGIKASVLLADVFGPYFAVDGNLNPSVCTSAQTGDKVGNLSMGMDADLGCRFQLFSDHQALQDRSLDMNLMSHHEPAPKKVLKLNGDNQVYTFGQYLPNPVSVKVTGWFGVPMNDAKVHFEVEKGDVSEAVVTTDQQGVATTRWRPGTPTGMDRLRVKVYDCDGNLTGETPQTFRAYTSSTDPCLQSNLTVEAYFVTENTIVPMVSGGRKPYRYSIDGLSYSSTQPSVTVQPGHDYHFYVLDANGCEAEALYNAAPYNCGNSMMQLSAVVSGNVITATASGGRAPYHYSIGGSYQSSGVFSGLLDGEYRVTVRDASGCERSKQVVVSHQGNLEVSISEIEGGAGTACVVTSTTTLAERGVCWSSHHTPTVQDFHTSYGTGSGDYDFTLTSLNPQVTYYVRAYALDASGTSYSREVCINPSQGLSMPMVVATGITCVAGTTAIGSGNVTYDGGAEVTERGICYGTGHLPGASGIHLVCGAGLGAFTMNITGLTPNTTYYARAYATNSQGTTYGNEVEFTTGDSDGGEVPEGAINGLFSVAPDYQVYFSKGNLQYQPSTNTWRFAENQYDMIHTAEDMSEYYEEIWDEEFSWGYYYCDVTNEYTDSYSGWIDLFGWGTSGYDLGAVCYQPWSVSENNFDYFAYGNPDCNLDEQTGQADWGYNAILNGGNIPNNWRTLTAREWLYLLKDRVTHSGIRFALAQVNQVNGLILLPDDWDNSYFELNHANQSDVSCSSNIIAATQWDALEQHGAVFIPASGNRSGTSIMNIEELGCYLSATHGFYSQWYTYCPSYVIAFSDENYELGIELLEYDRSGGASVRLVNSQWLSPHSPHLPQVTTSEVSGYTPVTAMLGGEVISEGGVKVTECGVCWSTSPNPTVDDNHINEGSVFSAFELRAVGLTPSTTYYVRAYATNAIGTAYGNEVTFTTLSAGGEGQDWVDLGLPSGTLWAECNIGANTPEGLGDYYAWGETQPKQYYGWDNYQYAHYHDDDFGDCSWLTKYCNLPVYGYNGYTDNMTVLQAEDDVAATDWGMLWSIPTIEQWQELEEHTSSSWTTRNGVFGRLFTASNGNTLFLPSSSFNGYGYANHGTYWSSSLCMDYPLTAWGINFNAGDGFDYYQYAQFSRSEGLAIRPVRFALPRVTTSEATEITATTAVLGGEVVSEGGSPVNRAGVCWSTNHNPTVNDSHSSVSIGEGVFSVPITGLTPFSTYYVRAYAINSDGTAYGNEVSFMTPPTGGLLGLFSVSDNHQVLFSQGNLQYQASTNTWKFAENQWDFVGTQNPIWGEGAGGTVAGSDNNNISPNYDGWIDLFGWGTSGYNHGAVCYQPWSTSVNNDDYYAYGFSFYHLDNQTGQADWGYNPIINGGNAEHLWRTPTYDEWYYLLNNRTTSSGMRFVKANVNGVNGVILLPDNWDASYYTFNEVNEAGANYNFNTIDDSQWNEIEGHNAVFLPAAGDRIGNVSYRSNTQGFYWSSSCAMEWTSYLSFLDSYLSVTSDDRYYGYSVRLVRSLQSFNVSANANPAEGGNVSGGGSFDAGVHCTLEATPNEGYVFLQWTENGRVVSTTPIYSFTVTSDRDLTANFIVPTGDNHESVDLGLPSGALWATCNVGAIVPESYGDYFAWGETQPKDYYWWSTYMHCNESYNQLTKYCNNPEYGYNGYTDDLVVLQAEDDAATANWGDEWRMPTMAEWMELYQNTNWIWTTQNGVNGCLFTGTNGNSIFIPAAGNSFSEGGESGCYWSNTLNVESPDYAILFLSSEWQCAVNYYYSRCYGYPVRPVRFTSPLGGLPEVTTSEVSEFYNNAALCGGTVLSDGGSSVTERGVCWSTSPNPTIIYSEHASAGSGVGSFTVETTEIYTGVTYYARAYAINGVGVAYGNEVEFMKHQGGGGGDGTGGECPEGGINALFTINENGDCAYFSQGNLQYQASTNTWKFADNQWDCIGEGNNNISPDYDGWIDLFGWATSGWNNGNTNYQPWDYLKNGNSEQGNGYGPTDGTNYGYSLTDDFANADWGVYNAISNGGNANNMWRTLNTLEWHYVFNLRNTNSGIRYAKANVNGVNGVILLPDAWDAEYQLLNNTNQPGASYNSNVITDSQWSDIELHGAVFLPAAGYRIENTTSNIGGCYWTSIALEGDSAFSMCFEEGSNLGLWAFGKYQGRSVRLIHGAGSGSGNGGGGRK